MSLRMRDETDDNVFADKAKVGRAPKAGGLKTSEMAAGDKRYGVSPAQPAPKVASGGGGVRGGETAGDVEEGSWDDVGQYYQVWERAFNRRFKNDHKKLTAIKRYYEDLEPEAFNEELKDIVLTPGWQGKDNTRTGILRNITKVRLLENNGELRGLVNTVNKQLYHIGSNIKFHLKNGGMEVTPVMPGNTDWNSYDDEIYLTTETSQQRYLIRAFLGQLQNYISRQDYLNDVRNKSLKTLDTALKKARQDDWTRKTMSDYYKSGHGKGYKKNEDKAKKAIRHLRDIFKPSGAGGGAGAGDW